MLNTFTFVFFALASGAGSVLALRGAWRGKSVASRMLALAGWMALIFSVLLWQQVYGIEFAVSYALAWFSLCAFVAVLLNRQYSAPRAAAELSLVTSGTTSASHKWLTFLAAGPLGLCASVPLTLAMARLLPVTMTSQMAIAAIAFPILWALAAYWVSARDNPGRFCLLFCVAGALALVALVLMGPQA